jgi:hypothetical protein
MRRTGAACGWPGIEKADKIMGMVAFNPTSVVALRVSHPHASAADVLEHVFRPLAGSRLSFGAAQYLPHPFALTVAEAFGHGMHPQEWAHWSGPPAHPQLVHAVQKMWAEDVWPLFMLRYELR